MSEPATKLHLFGEGSRPWPGQVPHVGELVDVGDRLWLVDAKVYGSAAVDVYCVQVSPTLEHELRRAWESWGSGPPEPVDDGSAADLTESTPSLRIATC